MSFFNETNFGLLKPDIILFLKNSEILNQNGDVIYEIYENSILDVNTKEKCGTIEYAGYNHNYVTITIKLSNKSEIDKVKFGFFRKNEKLEFTTNYLNEEEVNKINWEENGLPSSFWVKSGNLSFYNSYYEKNNYNHCYRKNDMPLFEIEYQNSDITNNLLKLEEKKIKKYKYIEFDSEGYYELDTHFLLNNKIASWSRMSEYEMESEADYVNWNDDYFAIVNKYNFTNKDDGFRFLKQLALDEYLIPDNSVVLVQLGFGKLYTENLYCFNVSEGAIDYSSCYKIELIQKPKLSEK